MMADMTADGITLEPFCRFANLTIPVRGTLYWDILYL
jgi:hypothetical protein